MTRYEPGTVVALDLSGEELNIPAMFRNLAERDESRHGANDGRMYASSAALLRIAAQIEAQTRPPKPPEPTGLGAVVEDSRGVRFVRTESAKGIRNPWSSALHPLLADEIESLAYADIDAVRVLSEGVSNG